MAADRLAELVTATYGTEELAALAASEASELAGAGRGYGIAGTSRTGYTLVGATAEPFEGGLRITFDALGA